MKGPPRQLDQTTPGTEELAAAIAGELVRVKSDLYARMLVAGLTPENGWRISEKLSNVISGTLWVFRPIHSRESSPDMEASVLIDEEGRVVRAEAR